MTPQSTGDVATYGRVGTTMVHERETIETNFSKLVQTIRRGLPSNPGGMNDDEFNHLCENIAHAIIQAVEAHETNLHSPTPEFGEEDRMS